ncbi:hypothetical protein RB595_008986 [Gaeumannomyces hyphopodioides]
MRLALAGPVTNARSHSRAATSFAGYEGRTIICAVAEARGVAPPVGIAIIDIELGQATLCQVADTQCYVHTIHKIRVHEPSHILVISSNVTPEKSMLCGVLEEEMVGANMVPLPRRYWTEEIGRDYIDKLAFPDDIDALKVSVEGKFFALCSLAAAFKYVESEASVRIAPNSMAIQYEPADDTMMIDVSSIHGLELLQNAQNPRSKNSLFGLLNHTLTPMGARYLRSSILQPSTKRELIEPRQVAVKELSDSQSLLYDVRNALKQLPDIDKVVSQLIFIGLDNHEDLAMTHEQKSMINCILQIKQFVAAVPALHEALTLAKCDVLVKAQAQCLPEITQKVLDIIDKHADKDAQFSQTPLERRTQTIYAIKAGLNPVLDLARKAFAEQQDNVHKHVSEFNAEHNLTSEIKFDSSRGYYLRFLASDYIEASIANPNLLINVVSKRAHCECQTIELEKLNRDIKAAEDETLMRGAKAIGMLAHELRTQIPALIRLCQAVGYLDMLASLAHVVTASDYCRPEFSTNMALKKARHPLVEKCVDNFVPYDIYASPQYSFQLMTGANMSGKSTFIRAAAAIQVMAQIGSFVPAQTASIPIVNKLFTRMIKDDCIEENVSAFSQEMREMAFVLRSLVIVDELGRGTSTRDGLAHLQTEVRTVGHGEAARQELKMLHTVAEGPVAQGDYGLQLAKAVGCPKPFLAQAQAVADKFRAEAEARALASGGDVALRRRALVGNLKEILLHLGADDSSCALLRGVQDEFVERMDAVGGGGGGNDDEEEDDDDDDDEEMELGESSM